MPQLPSCPQSVHPRELSKLEHFHHHRHIPDLLIEAQQLGCLPCLVARITPMHTSSRTSAREQAIASLVFSISISYCCDFRARANANVLVACTGCLERVYQKKPYGVHSFYFIHYMYITTFHNWSNIKSILP